MAINKSGKRWVGTTLGDIRESLEAYSADGYPSQEFRKAKCHRGGDVFELLADDDEGCAKRACPSCGAEHFICDSQEYWSDASPEKYACVECGSTTANIAAGFSLYEDGEVRGWMSSCETPQEEHCSQKLMRHADIQPTLNTYGDVITPEAQEAGSKIGEMALKVISE